MHFRHRHKYFGVDMRARPSPRRQSRRFRRISDPVEPGRRHLGTPGVLNAGENYGVHQSSSERSQLNTYVAASAPKNWENRKPGTSRGRMPANVSLAARARVTAGLANDVDDVNQ